MPELEVGGRRLAWREGGVGAPALMLHCTLGHSGAFGGIMARTRDRLATRAPDLPGHGGTGRDPGRAIHDQAFEDALRLLEGRGPAHLLGHSFGGTVALRIAVAAPEKVASLTLIEPVQFSLLAEADPAAYAAEAAAAAPCVAAMAAGDWPAAAAEFLGRWGAAPFAALAPAQAAEVLARMPLARESQPALSDPAVAPVRLAEVGGIRVPVLLIGGAASPPATHAILDALARALPQARRVEIPRAGHMAPITHAEAVSGALRDFLGFEQAQKAVDGGR
jgi:pimeloyl-ACP methyl ester carboxylesterase